jgi:seryl-tRNA synthetase
VPQLLTPLGIQGVYGRSDRYETVVEGLHAFISRGRPDDSEVLRFPPVVSRAEVERSGYLSSFPNLLGCVAALHGTDREIAAATERHAAGQDWTGALSATDLVLTPAACYPVYPLVANRGALPAGGRRFDVAAECFRHEPSDDPMRLQSFRMREYVCIGSKEEAVAFRAGWMNRAGALAEALGLPSRMAPATDPFFGRVGQVRTIVQRQQSLKFELLMPDGSGGESACVSFNYHQDHFGEAWALRDAQGGVAHSACVAFGMDRLALALFAQHGPEVEQWPDQVRRTLS